VYLNSLNMENLIKTFTLNENPSGLNIKHLGKNVYKVTSTGKSEIIEVLAIDYDLILNSKTTLI
jgi:hypothetical protein